MHRRIVALASAGFLFSCGGGGGSSTPAEWTVLVYMVADNDLEQFAVPNLQQMAAVGSSEKLNIVAEVDRSLKHDATAIGNISASPTTKRLLVHTNSFEQLEDLGNIDSAKPAALADFIQWGMKKFPAKNYALVLWDHGGGWTGFGLDEPAQDIMSLSGITQALHDGLAAAGVARLQLLGFDACLMSTLEVMESIKPYASFLVASEETEPGAGWDYSVLGPARDTAVEAATLGRAFVDGFVAANASEGSITMALTDLTVLTGMETALAHFDQQITPQLAAAAVTVARSREAALEFGRNPDPAQSQHMLDFGDLLAQLDQVDAARFASLAAETREALGAVVKYRKAGSATSASTGISIYFPAAGPLPSSYLALPGMDSWRHFLQAYFDQGATAPVPTLGAITPTVNLTAGSVEVSAPIAANGNAVASATMRFGFSFPESAPGAADDEIDLYGDRPAAFSSTAVSASWNKSLARLTQGQLHSYAYLSVESRSPALSAAMIPLAYLASGATSCAGAPVAVREILFDPATGAVSSDRYFLNQQSGISELKPAAGTSFKPVVYAFVNTVKFTKAATAQGWSCIGDQFAADQAIALDFYGPTVSGLVEFTLLLSAENAAGKGDTAVVFGTF
jgi:hypothetical protein